MRVCDSLLPSLRTEFNVTTGSAARTISAFTLAYGAMQLFFGPLGDRFGKVRVIAFATLGCMIGNVGAAVSCHLNQMLVARALSGAASAGIVPLTMAWIGDTVPYESRQEILARLLGATVFGMIAGQWLGALVAETFNWRISFAMLAAIALFSGLLVIRDDSATSPESTTQAHRFGDRALRVLSFPWAQVVLFITFIEGALALSALAFIPSHLHSAYDIPMAKAGAIVATYGIGGLIYSRCARFIVGRFGESNLARLGGACLAIAYASFALVNIWAFTLPACLLAGFGFYALHNTLQTHATQMAPEARGTAVALFSCVLAFGQSLGVLVAAWFIDRFSVQSVFLFSAAGLFLIGLTFSALLAKHATRFARM